MNKLFFYMQDDSTNSVEKMKQAIQLFDILGEHQIKS